MHKKGLFFLTFFCLAVSLPAHANEEALIRTLQMNMQELQKTVAGLKTTVLTQNEIIRSQSLRIDAIERQPGSSRVPVAAGPSSQGPLKTAGIHGISPDIGVTSTIETKLTQDSADRDGNDTIALKELGLHLAQTLDAHSRLDAVVVLNDNLENQNVDIEEAYYSRWNLPLGFRGRIGKFRAKIGKMNLNHLHDLENSDYPLVIRDFFGDEGLSSSGARLEHGIPNPWNLPFNLTGEVLRGNNGNSFSGISRRPIFNAHADTQFEFSKDSNLELGATTLFGDENPSVKTLDGDGNEVTVIREKGSDHYGVKVYGADATFQWKLAEERVLKFQNEVYFQRRGTNRRANENPWGFYNLLDYRFHPRFGTGIRFDYVEPLDIAGDHHSTYGVSPYLTFFQSEFANFKLQVSHTEPADGAARSNNEIFLTANVMMGAHEHD